MSDAMPLPPLPEPDLTRWARDDAWYEKKMRAYGEACAAEEHKRMNAVLAAQSAAHHREVRAQVAAEREACAKVCEEQALSDENCKCPFAVSGWWPDQVTYRCSAAIRARGETP